MSPKKGAAKSKNVSTSRKNGLKVARVVRSAGSLSQSSNGYAAKSEPSSYPARSKPELSPEAEAKRLARKKAITLKALQTAYENHHSRKNS